MASEAEEILAIDTKEDIDDDENIIEIPIDEPPDRPDVPMPIKTREFQCEICFKVLSSKNNLKEIDLLCPTAWIRPRDLVSIFYGHFYQYKET